MKKIFISYRRVDAYETHRLSAALKSEYGNSAVFLDAGSLKPGQYWKDKLHQTLQEADALLVVIGYNWLHIQDEASGKRRIDQPNDWVRNEITTFLQRKVHKPELSIIPVLIDGAMMPLKEFLDPELNPVCDFQAVRINYTGGNIDFAEIKKSLKDVGFHPIAFPPVVTPFKEFPPNPITEEEEGEFLTEYKMWTVIEYEKPGYYGEYMRELYRMYEFSSYEEAFKFILKVDKMVIRPLNHHPRWQNTYNRLEFWLCTFNIGHRPSTKDTQLARALEEAWVQFSASIKKS